MHDPAAGRWQTIGKVSVFALKPVRKALSMIGIVLGLFVVTSYSHLILLASLPWSDMRLLDQRIYVDPDLGEPRSRQLRDAWQAARARIERRFGLDPASPVLVVTMHQATARRYGLGGHSGIAFALPWRHYIVVRWREDFVDLLAHELMHAQVRDLVGYPRYLLDMPTWLDEGLAMQVDDRADYAVGPGGTGGDEIARVRQLVNPGQFWSDDGERNLDNYRAVKAVVAELLHQHAGSVSALLAAELDAAKARPGPAAD